MKQRQWTPKPSPEMAPRPPHHLRIRIVDRVLDPFRHPHIYIIRLVELHCLELPRHRLRWERLRPVSTVCGSLVGDISQHPFHKCQCCTVPSAGRAPRLHPHLVRKHSP